MRLFFALLTLAACDSVSLRELTYHRDIAPLLAEKCQDCHYQNGVAPVPTFVDYDSARSYGDAIRVKVSSRAMPPWGADNSGACGTWADARWLSPHEIAAFVEWQENGAPEGPPDSITAATPLATPFRRDAGLDIGGMYQPGVGDGGNRCFITDPMLDRDRLLTAIRIVADDPRAIAQVTLFSLDSDSALAEAQMLDDSEPGLGYSCFGTTRTDDSRLLASWTWPAPILPLPEGTGVRLYAGRKLIVQIHYLVSDTGDAFVSGTQVDLQLDDGVNEAQVLPISAAGPLAPGLASASAEGRLAIDRKLRVVGVAPRMHIRGKTLAVTSSNGAGCLASFGNWYFYEQQLFRAVAPATLEPGDELQIDCSYNTTGRTAPVPFGDSIDEEECIAYLFVTD